MRFHQLQSALGAMVESDTSSGSGRYVYYHVTTADKLTRIARSGLKPGNTNGIGGSQYDTNRQGSVFIADKKDVFFWWSKADEWIFDRYDDFDTKGITPVILRVTLTQEPEKDEVASKEGRDHSFKLKGSIPASQIEIWTGSSWERVRALSKKEISQSFDDGYIKEPRSNPLYPDIFNGES